jgi:hypothetical protein
MTQTYVGLAITLAEDCPAEALEPLVQTLKMLAGVSDVRPVAADPGLESLLTHRRDSEWADALSDVIAALKYGHVNADAG